MIKLFYNEEKDEINTTWLLKINKNKKNLTTKNGEKREYYSYVVTFPQEIYEFLEIRNRKFYLTIEKNKNKEIVITSKKPNFLTKYTEIKLINRRKRIKNNKIPTTSFIIPKKYIKNLENCNYLQITLYPTQTDSYRKKMGKITVKAVDYN